MYKLITNPTTNSISVILRLTDNSNIPVDLLNRDYQEYLKWLEQGNTPLPPDDPQQENN